LAATFYTAAPGLIEDQLEKITQLSPNIEDLKKGSWHIQVLASIASLNRYKNYYCSDLAY